jgi:hypothetical protein
MFLQLAKAIKFVNGFYLMDVNDRKKKNYIQSKKY